jgi:uncharacterized protein (UPF0335 family)
MQEESDENSADAVAAMDEEIQRLQEELPGLKEEEKKVQAELSSLNAVPLLSELRAEIEKLESEKESLAASLAKVHGDCEVNVSPQESEAVRKDWKLWQVQARVRARICRDLWLKCSETLPEGTTREELWVCISASPSKLQANRLLGAVGSRGQSALRYHAMSVQEVCSTLCCRFLLRGRFRCTRFSYGFISCSIGLHPCFS